MRINRLELSDFRNYEKQILFFHEKTNIILGNNGQGKSNLLEAIYMLSMGKSFRTQKDLEMIRFGANFLRVCGSFEKGGRTTETEVMLSGEEKKFRIDGFLGSKNADLLENVYMVVFSPEDMRIVKEDPDKRRRFMDRELFQIKPLYYKDLSRYKKSVLHRNAVLKAEIPNEDMLDVWDENLFKYGSKIIRERRYFIEKLKKISMDIHASVTDGKEFLEVSYAPDIAFAEDSEEQRDIFIGRLRECRASDMARRFTGAGPHRDDMSVFIGGMDVKRFGSQGQQRTAALSLKLAELSIIKEETGEDAIILLDDVLSELDEERRRFLIRSLSKNQVFISAAEMSAEIRESLPAGRVYFVSAGRAEPADFYGENAEDAENLFYKV
ncbi:MAG: DNA replication/repair protein RecF [Clostridiales Family XIII bacterium]|jgi:DNA replication and repair protein RecF|nr:DNA replication/repair protein RecF [Clostridiales Family XIII bacterium]